MRLLLDPKNEELADILNTLLTDNIDITAREVARRHSTLKNPSAFTRNEARCRIPDDHMVACETDAGVSDTTLSSPASAYCS